jgi:hypothetical protein
MFNSCQSTAIVLCHYIYLFFNPTCSSSPPPNLPFLSLSPLSATQRLLQRQWSTKSGYALDRDQVFNAPFFADACGDVPPPNSVWASRLGPHTLVFVPVFSSSMLTLKTLFSNLSLHLPFLSFSSFL